MRSNRRDSLLCITSQLKPDYTDPSLSIHTHIVQGRKKYKVNREFSVGTVRRRIGKRTSGNDLHKNLIYKGKKEAGQNTGPQSPAQTARVTESATIARAWINIQHDTSHHQPLRGTRRIQSGEPLRCCCCRSLLIRISTVGLLGIFEFFSLISSRMPTMKWDS